jgi:hypothetical protein
MQILEGHFSADDSARLCRNYRYAAERMTRILAGWIALTPELSAKLLLGRHVWDIAQHADEWGRRLPELRAHAQESEPANDAFVAFMDAIEAPDAPGETALRLAGIYRVLKPHLLAVYVKHLESANPIYEPPTCRILARCIEDERRHIGAGETILRHLVASPETEARVANWQAKLAGMLEAARGVTGEGLPPTAGVANAGATPPMSDDASEFIRLERAGEKWSMPEDLETRVRAFGDALVACDGIALGRDLDAAPDAALLLALTDVRLARYQMVAFAKVGRHRIVKYRLEGARGTVTLNARWEQGESGWRVGALDLVKIAQSQPA